MASTTKIVEIIVSEETMQLNFECGKTHFIPNALLELNNKKVIEKLNEKYPNAKIILSQGMKNRE